MSIVASVKRGITAIKERNRTIRLAFRYPPHPSREDDPQYWRFNDHRRRLVASDGWYCHSCGKREPNVALELHHKLPYAMQGGISIERLSAALGRPLMTEDQFFDWFHREQTMPLCRVCHQIRHSVPEPIHRALLVWDRSVPFPVRVRRRKKG